MKLKISFVTALCVVSSVFAQSYKVHYTQKIKIEESQLASLPEATRQQLQKLSKYYSLYINDGQSVYKTLDSAPQSVLSEKENEKTTTMIRMKKDKYDVYKNFKNNSFYIETTLGDEHYNVAGELPNLAWKTTNDTDTILGYNVKKAIGEHNGKSVSVWYTEEIPVKDGPALYRGVNGLVLKVELGKDVYVATSVEKGDKEKINYPKDKNTISLAEYYKKNEEFKQKLLNNLQNSTNGTTTRVKIL